MLHHTQVYLYSVKPQVLFQNLNWQITVAQQILIYTFAVDVNQIPNYYKIIVTPMDLGTIRSQLSKTHFNHYQTIEEFVADVQLVFTNCATFNPVSYSYYVFNCRSLLSDAECHLQLVSVGFHLSHEAETYLVFLIKTFFGHYLNRQKVLIL